MSAIRYSRVSGASKVFFAFVFFLVTLVLAGLFSAHFMDVNGHHVTGMSNKVVWGLPHVFAIFLIVGASGSLNIASIGSVFAKDSYKALGRLSALISIAFLVGGLSILVLDLGRPDRLIIAMTHFNFKSIFAWNIFLYVGFIFIAIVYLCFMFQANLAKHLKQVGMFAFGWRFVLTSGTGSIFGFLVARKAYDTAILAPLFIVLSLVIGTAIFVLIHTAIVYFDKRGLCVETIKRLTRLLAIFLGLLLYMDIIQHISFSYATERHGVEWFVLSEGGLYSTVFWLGQILLGILLPLILFLAPYFSSVRFMLIGCGMVLMGGFSQLYVLIIGGQAYPIDIFPGYSVNSGFFSDHVASYMPTYPELLLGIGGLALSIMLIIVVIRILPFVEDRSTSSF